MASHDPRNGALLVKHAHQFNNALSMTSLKAKKADVPGRHGWAPSVVIQGKMSHFVGPVDQPVAADRLFAQLYVHDPTTTEDRVIDLRLQRMHLPRSRHVR